MTEITKLAQLDLNQSDTYTDYLTWRFKETVELIKNQITLMSPAPTVYHQRVERKLLITIDYHLKGKNCEVFITPLDVRL